MKAIDNLRAQLARIGATLDDTPYSLHCDAPQGYVWRANGETGYSIHYASNSQSWLTAALKEELPALKMGLRKCTPEETIEINFSHGLGGEGEEPAWIAPDDAPSEINWIN